MSSFHQYVQQQIVEICNEFGLEAKSEYRGKGWIADIMVQCNDVKYVFEIQTSPQTLKRTIERQAKYKRDGIIGCWLFEKEPAKMRLEMEDLPVFQIEDKDGNVYVSLKGRKTLPLKTFIHDFVNGRIRFCRTLNPLPYLEVKFMEMDCWKCGAVNHIHYVQTMSACNTRIYPYEEMWSSTNRYSLKPEILKKIRDFANSEEGSHLNPATVKRRYSGTVGDSYVSFGCSVCDSIFGDWFVEQMVIERYNENAPVVDTLKIKVDFPLHLRQSLPHWCHPGNHPFCDEAED